MSLYDPLKKNLNIGLAQHNNNKNNSERLLRIAVVDNFGQDVRKASFVYYISKEANIYYMVMQYSSKGNINSNKLPFSYVASLRLQDANLTNHMSVCIMLVHTASHIYISNT